MCQQPGRICQQLLLLFSPCQAGAQLMHHLCRGQKSTSTLLLCHTVALANVSAQLCCSRECSRSFEYGGQSPCSSCPADTVLLESSWGAEPHSVSAGYWLQVLCPQAMSTDQLSDKQETRQGRTRTVQAPGKVEAALLGGSSRRAFSGRLLWAALHDGAPPLHELASRLAAAQRHWDGSAPLQRPCSM